MVKKRWKSEKEFNQYLAREYLKYGSVDEVLKKHNYDLPISYANYQRILDKWGVIKAAGPNSRFAETVEFLSRLAEERVPLETLYKKTPTRFKASVATMHRILSYVKEGVTRRIGTSLVITPYNSDSRILIARDVSEPRVELGKEYGLLTIPTGFARKRDLRRVAIKRVLQQEVLTDFTIGNKFPKKLISENPNPFLYIDVADVRVEVYHIKLPKKFSTIKCFSSYKLDEFEFLPLNKLLANKDLKFRAGVREVLFVYKKYKGFLRRNLAVNPMFEKAVVNARLVARVDV